MLIVINHKTMIPYHTVKAIHYSKEKDTTSFLVGKDNWVSTEGDWRKKIINALKVRAVAVYRDRYELHS